MTTEEIVETQCPIATVFELPSIEFVKHDDFYSVVASKFIKKDSVLIIEHVFSAKDRQFLLECIAFSNTLYNSLYPREDVWSYEKTQSYHESIVKKYNHNAFDTNGMKQMCHKINRFNHSTTNNADVADMPLQLKDGTFTYFKAVISNCDIQVGKEICIRYNSYLDDECKFPDGSVNPPTDLSSLKKYPIIEYQPSRVIYNKLLCLIQLYKQTPMFQTIVIQHALLKLGCNIICSVPSFSKRLDFFKMIGIQDETPAEQQSTLFNEFARQLISLKFE